MGREAAAVLVLALLLVASGCGVAGRDRPIDRLEALANGNPQPVSVRGRVLRISPLLSGVAYEVEDDSGSSIWVHSSGPAAFAPGDVIRLQGLLRRRDIAVNGSDFGELYIEAEAVEHAEANSP